MFTEFLLLIFLFVCLVFRGVSVSGLALPGSVGNFTQYTGNREKEG